MVVVQALATNELELPTGFVPLIRATPGWVGLDDSTGNMVFLDEARRARRTLLRRGQGPAEFISIGWLGNLADTIVAWDRQQRRILVVPLPGDSVAIMDLRATHRGGEVIGMLNTRTPLVSIPGVDERNSPGRVRIAVIRKVLNSSAESVAVLHQAPNLHVRLRRERGDLSFTIARPFSASDRVALLPGGRVALLKSSPFEFRCCHDDSFSTVVRLSSVDNGRVTAWDRRQMVEGLPLLAEVDGDSLWPRRKAPLRNELPFVGVDGSVWVRLFSNADSANTTFAVIADQQAPGYVRLSGRDLALFSVSGSEVIAGRLGEDGAYSMQRFTWRMR